VKSVYLRIAMATIFVTVGAVCYLAGKARAGVPQQPPVLSYSGVLLDATTGTPATGTVNPSYSQASRPRGVRSLSSGESGMVSDEDRVT
jgi:hypothetical protein